MAEFLTENCKITNASNTTAGAAATSDITSSAIDMAGFDGCLFIIPIGTLASGAVTSIKAQQCDTSGGSYADLVGSGITVAEDEDDEVRYIDVHRPQERFLKCVVDRGTGNATIGGIIAIQYRGRSLPVTHGTGVSGEQHSSIAEGSA